MSQRILPGAVVVGIDGSTPGNRALDTALEAAVSEHRSLHLVHCYEPYPAVMGMTAPLADVTATIEAAAQNVLRAAQHYVEERQPGLEVTTGLSKNDARHSLVALSERAALLVVGSRGLGSVRGMLLGSVGSYVSQHAACPVLVVRPDPTGATTRILVGADGTAASVSAIEFAIDHASMRRLDLTVVHLVPDAVYAGYGIWRELDEDLDHLPRHRLDLAESLAGLREKYPDVDVEVRLERGNPGPSLIKMSAHYRLLVVGAERRSRLSTMLHGSVSRVVVEHAHCPVAVVATRAA